MSTGYGTYISAGIMLAATLAHQFGWIDDATYQTMLGLAGAGGISFLRASVSASDAKTATGQAIIAEHLNVPAPTIKAQITDPAGVPPAPMTGPRGLG